MELRTLSEKRGIYSIYNGEQYIIYSSYYGVVAYSTNIERVDIEDGEIREKTKIDFDICQWYGYWDLKSIISRGIKKLENRYIKKDIEINYYTILNTDNSLENKKYLKVELVDR